MIRERSVRWQELKHLVRALCVVTLENIGETAQFESENGKIFRSAEMMLKLFFFGATADATGHRVLEVPELIGLSADRSLEVILERFPRLSSHKLHFAINQEFAVPTSIIRDGDEIAIFTAVSGG